MLDDYRADLARFHRASGRLTPPHAMRLVVDHSGLQALAVYRLARWVYVRAAASRWSPWRLLAAPTRWASRVAGTLYGIYLDPAAEIGPGLYIGHSGGIHVAHCRIGRGCSIHQRVRIDARDGREGPVVGDRVWIGCHASVEGSLHVGSGSTLAAGAVITHDVPERALIVGSPGRVIQRDYDNAGIL